MVKDLNWEKLDFSNREEERRTNTDYYQELTRVSQKTS
jgi:hypothetical protein